MWIFLSFYIETKPKCKLHTIRNAQNLYFWSLLAEMLNSGLFHNRIFEASVGLGTIILISLITIHKFSKPKRKITRIIDTMEALMKDTVHIENRDHVEEIVSQLIKGGASKLQVISDFDHTISRFHSNGNECTSTYGPSWAALWTSRPFLRFPGVIENGPFLTDEYRYQAKLLLNYYYPIECDPKLTVAEKTPYMKDWYTKSLSLITQSGLNKRNISDMVRSSNMLLRDGCNLVFHQLHKHDVPLLIFSAGVGDVLKEVLHQENLLYPNIKIIANFMKFDDEENMTGFKGEMIHTFNKNQSSLENSDYFQHLKSRCNAILLGDSLGDLDMSEGANNINSMLRIGFLNKKIEENLPVYLDAYDIVLTDDQTMDIVIGLLRSIL